jgi:hypothetical protein
MRNITSQKIVELTRLNELTRQHIKRAQRRTNILKALWVILLASLIIDLGVTIKNGAKNPDNTGIIWFGSLLASVLITNKARKNFLVKAVASNKAATRTASTTKTVMDLKRGAGTGPEPI